MRAHVHLHSPPGEPTRRMVQLFCDALYYDNLLWISARNNSGLDVPRCAKEGGIQYRPPIGAEKSTPDQGFYSAPFMFHRGHGSCCDIAPYDAAALTILYDLPSRPMAPAQGRTSYHCNVLTPWGAYDPSFRWSDPAYVLPPLSWPKPKQHRYIRELVTSS